MNSEITYTHRTRNGLKARILCSNLIGTYPVVAAVKLRNVDVEKIVPMYADLTLSLNCKNDYDLFEYSPWTDVAVDTKVMVCQTLDHDCWVRRHFAKFDGKHVHVWEDGRTSWTTTSVVPYKYAKLVDES